MPQRRVRIQCRLSLSFPCRRPGNSFCEFFAGFVKTSNSASIARVELGDEFSGLRRSISIPDQTQDDVRPFASSTSPVAAVNFSSRAHASNDAARPGSIEHDEDIAHARRTAREPCECALPVRRTLPTCTRPQRRHRSSSYRGPFNRSTSVPNGSAFSPTKNATGVPTSFHIGGLLARRFTPLPLLTQRALIGESGADRTIG